MGVYCHEHLCLIGRLPIRPADSSRYGSGYHTPVLRISLYSTSVGGSSLGFQRNVDRPGGTGYLGMGRIGEVIRLPPVRTSSGLWQGRPFREGSRFYDSDGTQLHDAMAEVLVEREAWLFSSSPGCRLLRYLDRIRLQRALQNLHRLPERALLEYVGEADLVLAAAGGGVETVARRHHHGGFVLPILLQHPDDELLGVGDGKLGHQVERSEEHTS